MGYSYKLQLDGLSKKIQLFQKLFLNKLIKLVMTLLDFKAAAVIGAAGSSASSGIQSIMMSNFFLNVVL